jgi:hypothetical protein
MTLIEEIEAAAKRQVATYGDDVTVERFVRSRYWPRIRAAIEAGREMTSDNGVRYLNGRDKFREAIGK